MTDLESKIKQAAENAVLKFVSEGNNWLAPDYHNRFKIPSEWVIECWNLVDAEKVRAQVAAKIENELAERMVNHIASELATDIKQILSVKERREMLRSIARNHMDEVMKAGAN